MYYIISPIKLERLQDFNVPIKDKYGNRDTDLFFNSQQGLEFLKYHPLKIKNEKNKLNVIYSLQDDITWISLCYNCPLYIYVLTDSWYLKNLNLDFVNYVNLKRISKMCEYSVKDPKSEKYKVNKKERYFSNGNYDDVSNIVLLELNKWLKNTNLVKTPVLGLKLTVEKGFEKIEI